VAELASNADGRRHLHALSRNDRVLVRGQKDGVLDGLGDHDHRGVRFVWATEEVNGNGVASHKSAEQVR
jgi:hypothetical protein